MASQYLYPDYIFSHPGHHLLLDGLSSSDGSSGSPAAATVSMHWAAGEVNNYLPPIPDYSTSFTNSIDTDTLVNMPLDHYSSSDISSSSATTTTTFFGSGGGLDYSSSFWPAAPPPPASYPIITAAENWEINQSGGIDGMGQDPSTLKVSRYSAEEKKHRINRYLKKKSQRNFNKTIKYACRKNLADKRIRVRGRFAKNKNHDVTSSDDDHHYQTLAHNYHTLNIDPSCYNTSTDDLSFLQMKTAAASEEEWLQEAIASFMYYRILPDGSSVS